MAHLRHKRDTNARRKPKAHLVAGPVALLATVSTVGLGVLATSPETRENLVANSNATIFAADASTNRDDDARSQTVSRSDSRVDFVNLQKAFDVNTTKIATQRAIKKAHTKRWTTVDLNLWTSPKKKAEKIGLLKSGKHILVTGRKTPERVEVVVNGKSRWVTAGYLAAEKPTAGSSTGAAAGGSTSASCTNGSAVPSGVSPNIAAVHRAVCANFPEISTYGTFRGGGGDHPSGRAVDIMVSGSRGWQVAEFVRAHYAEFGVSYVIYSQKIWSVERSGEGWRGMSDRGSTTANHYDHVHVSTY